MDRYGASTRDIESDDDFSYDSPRRGGERSGRDRRSDLFHDDDAECERTIRELREQRSRRGAEASRPNRHFSAASSEAESEYSDSELEREIRERRVQRSRRGADSRHPGSGLYVEDSDSESDFEPRAARGHSGRGARRGTQTSRRSDLRLSGEDSQDDSDSTPRRSRAGYGIGGRRSTAASYVDYQGPTRAGSVGDDSENERYGSRREYGRDARGGMRSRRAQELLSEDEDYDSQLQALREGSRRGPGFGGASRRVF